MPRRRSRALATDEGTASFEDGGQSESPYWKTEKRCFLSDQSPQRKDVQRYEFQSAESSGWILARPYLLDNRRTERDESARIKRVSK